jgi:hypothetical protein
MLTKRTTVWNRMVTQQQKVFALVFHVQLWPFFNKTPLHGPNLKEFLLCVSIVYRSEQKDSPNAWCFSTCKHTHFPKCLHLLWRHRRVRFRPASYCDQHLEPRRSRVAGLTVEQKMNSKCCRHCYQLIQHCDRQHSSDNWDHLHTFVRSPTV